MIISNTLWGAQSPVLEVLPLVLKLVILAKGLAKPECSNKILFLSKPEILKYQTFQGNLGTDAEHWWKRQHKYKPASNLYVSNSQVMKTDLLL